MASTQIAVQQKKKLDTMKGYILAKKDELFQALPKHVTPDRMLSVVMDNIRKNPDLLDCTPVSVLQCIADCSVLGLQPNSVLGHAYLVPFNNRKEGIKECQLIVGYKGLIDLARRSGTVSTVVMEVVYEGDEFDYGLGDDSYIHHHPSDDIDREEKPITHVYAVVKLRDGGVQRKVWTKAKIDKHAKRYSKAYGKGYDSPWSTDYATMAKKTVIRDMINRGEVPVSAELQTQTMREEIIEAQNWKQISASKPVASLDDLTERLTGNVEPQDSTTIDATTEPEPEKPKRAKRETAPEPEYTSTDGSLFHDESARFEAENPIEHP